MTELELYIQLMTVYLYDNFLFLRQILTLMCQITSEGYFSGNFRSPGGSCQLWLAHPCTTACGGHQSRPRQQNIRPLVAGPTKIIRPLGIYTELLRPSEPDPLQNYATTGYTLDYCAHRARRPPKIIRPRGIHWTTAVRAALAGAIRVPLAALLYRPQGLALCVHNGRR